ncbi:MAG TPA: M36 family metallopeptidase [Steroidobacteraceae bacterium]|nr:M36 family metallopeptidase [Steroidobacteraceae bacterium]
MYSRNSVRLLSAAIVACLAAAAAPTHAAAPAEERIALDYLKSQRQAMGLNGSDIREAAIASSVLSKHSGVTHVYLQQYYRGIEVWNGVVNVNVTGQGKVISSGNRFVPDIAAAVGGQNARKSAVEAAHAAAGHLKLNTRKPLEVVERKGGLNQAVKLSNGGIAARPIEARLVWLPTAGNVRLAWAVEIEQATGGGWWYAFVDAESGESLGRESLVTEDSARSIADAIARPAGSPAALPAFAPIDGSAYRVFPIPLESPTDGERSLVTGAANPDASPFGWHDTNGAAGPEFTRTRGNNVHAYADVDNNNQPDPGSDPDGGPSLTFDFPLDFNLRPFDSQAAMVTNLFYWNNIVHDVTHNYGFDEASGNFQVNNYGRGGTGNDDVRAEAQDGSGRNNANFSTGVDGQRPRMQMFEWRSADPNPITVAAPSPIAGTYYGPMAGFGESLVTTGPITGQVVLVSDTIAPASDGCEPFVGFPAGAIALVDRGNCNFTVKVKNAQNAGARATIVVNNIAGPATAMGGTDPTVTIPSVMVTLNDGTLLKANAPFEATLADGTGGAPDRDSDLDAGIIAHEYGHGISNRLTGGRTTASCLNNAEQMGEGWSDWFGMTLTTSPSDRPSTRRGVGTYVSFQPADGLGIRPTQYTTDMSVNPSTYAWVADTVNISQPHGIGYVWNSMLWEMYWNLVDRHGYNADIYAPWASGGNNLAFQLVMDGMKLQPCRPGFVDGRNAILVADVALTGGKNQCEIWRGFAKRGLGFSASQGSSNDRADGVEAFDLPAACAAATFGSFKQPIAAAPSINNWAAGDVVPVKFDAAGSTATMQIDSQTVECSTLEITGAAPTVIASPGSSTLVKKGNEYRVNWQTDAAWAGTCRRLTVRIPSAADAVAYFWFK